MKIEVPTFKIPAEFYPISLPINIYFFFFRGVGVEWARFFFWGVDKGVMNNPGTPVSS